MQAKRQLANVPVYQPGKPMEEVQKELGLKTVIKLASNENPFGFSPAVRETIQHELEMMPIYPDGGSLELRAVMSEKLGVPQDHLIFGNGSDEIIQFISRTYLQEGTNTVMATHTFPQYKSNAMIENAEIREIPLKNGDHDLDAMLNAIDDQTRVVWICNPNNPTGTIVRSEELVSFLDQVSSDVLVVLDEAYYEYVTDPKYPDSVSLLERYPNLLILRTFSKIYGLASLRIGYGIGHPDVIDDLNHVREPFNTNRLAQKAAVAALADQDFIQQCRAMNRKGLEQLYEGFKRLNLTYYPSQANFVLVHVKKDGNDVFNALLHKGIIVRSGVPLGFPEYIRMTVGTEEQNKKVLNALADVLDQ
ncbi:MAG: histidinol-phosphate transaminase [Bacillaceae bacterium]|nr:histidinol-phosphate transaminase [Bacillaceae bacterium]